MNVRYTGPALDYSGYGEANRHDIAALISAGVGVTVELTRHTLELADFGELGQLVQEHNYKPMDYSVKILHTTPNIYGQFIEAGKYHIGRVFWETDRLPRDFALGAQACDEIWTGSEFNAQAIRNAGVTKPIYIIPEAIKTDIGELVPFIAENKNKETYNFYSIFEWTERKNPEALLEAYWREFENVDNVSLTIKTYLDNFSTSKKQEINERITGIKKRLNLKRYAPLYLYRNLMDRNQIYRFHKTYDCFVSAHRGEGWGIPQMEAMLVGNTMISTACGGIHEHMKPDEAYLVSYELEPLRNNNRNTQWYTPDQKWAKIDGDSLRRAMRSAYNNRLSSTMGEKAKKAVEERFSIEAVGKIMAERLSQIPH